MKAQFEGGEFGMISRPKDQGTMIEGTMIDYTIRQMKQSQGYSKINDLTTRPLK